MSSRWNRLGFVAPVVMMGAAFALGGCVNNDISLSITRFVAPNAAMAATNVCEFDTMGLTLARGTYDAALAGTFGAGYYANFIIQNNLDMIMTEPIETQAYYIQSFDVILETSGAATGGIMESGLKFSYPVSTTRLGPGDSQVFNVQAIAAESAPTLLANIRSKKTSAAVTMHLRAVSTRAEEQQVGAYSTFPIDVCDGCLTTNPVKVACSDLAGQTPLAGNACNYAADANVTCCTDSQKQVVCGSQVMAIATADAAGM